MKKEIISSEAIKQFNRSKIYRAIYEAGKISKPLLAQELGLSLPTVNQNIAHLTERGLIIENGFLESRGGRKAVALSVSTEVAFSIGIDITKTHIRYVLVNILGEVVEKKRIARLFESTPEYFSGLGVLVKAVCEENELTARQLIGIGISMPGILTRDKSALSYSHVLKVKDLPFSRFEEGIGSSCPLYFFNDADAAAIDEIWNRKDEGDFFYLAISETVGGAMVIANEIYTGGHQRAGEVGHMTLHDQGDLCYCGKLGCMDPYASIHTIGDPPEEFFAALAKKNHDATRIWKEYTHNLALAINNIRMVLDCDIVLGGYLSEYIGENFSDIVDQVAAINTFEQSIEFLKLSRSDQFASAKGAALISIDRFLEEI